MTQATDSDLDADELLRSAQNDVGLNDWGDATLPARFGLAVAYINSVPMTPHQRDAAAITCHRLLTNRLRFFGDRNRFPIADEVIERPMFTTGEARSGTTLMHALMSVDPHARALRFWEIMYPSPPPGVADDVGGRQAMADYEWRQINATLSKWMRSHPYNDMLGNGLPEDDRTWNFDFRAMSPSAWWRVPMRNASMGLPKSTLPSDAAAQCRLHKMFLQHCQYGRPKRYWVLKGHHGFRLKEFFDTYPDARFVWLHRDPVQVAASSTMMLADIADGIVGEIDLLAEARLHVERARQSIANTMASPLLEDTRIQHVRYADFVRDPIGTVREFYAFAGRELAPEAEHAMRSYLSNNKPDRYGKFEYSTKLLVDAGYDLNELHEEFRPFRERFGVEIEHRS